MDKTKPFGLVLPKRSQAFRPKTNAAFGSDSDDEPAKKKICTKIPQAKPLSKLTIKAEECEDPSIYEYDSIYDEMKAQEVQKVAKKDNKPSRYIDSLLKAADKRKKQYERRVEKKVHVEREKEGDKFKDKEAFVTSAYKKKMQEMEEQEERERRENQLNDMMDVTKQKDLSGFYRHFLKQSVGEEKIPEFGKDILIKKEPKSESDTEQNEKPIKDSSPTEEIPEQNIDQDSDIVSSSEEETPTEDHDASSGCNKNNRSPRSIKDSCDGNKSDDNNETNKSEDILKRKKLTSRNIRKRTEDVSSQSSSEADSHDEGNSIPNITETNENVDANKSVKEKGVPNSEPIKTEARKNIFEKRTVGTVFAEAQARYFQRLASRGSM